MKKLIKILSWTVFLLYLLLLADLLFISRTYDNSYGVNLVPMNQIELFFGLLKSSNYSFRKLAIINLVGNIAIFIPFGFFLSFLVKRYRNYFKLFFFSLLFIFLCEFIQYYFKVGTFDIDDIILNLLGVTVGYLLFVVFRSVYEHIK